MHGDAGPRSSKSVAFPARGSELSAYVLRLRLINLRILTKGSYMVNTGKCLRIDQAQGITRLRRRRIIMAHTANLAIPFMLIPFGSQIGLTPRDMAAYIAGVFGTTLSLLVSYLIFELRSLHGPIKPSTRPIHQAGHRSPFPKSCGHPQGRMLRDVGKAPWKSETAKQVPPINVRLARAKSRTIDRLDQVMGVLLFGLAYALVATVLIVGVCLL